MAIIIIIIIQYSYNISREDELTTANKEQQSTSVKEG
jgi:hypothetical protein